MIRIHGTVILFPLWIDDVKSSTAQSLNWYSAGWRLVSSIWLTERE